MLGTHCLSWKKHDLRLLPDTAFGSLSDSLPRWPLLIHLFPTAVCSSLECITRRHLRQDTEIDIALQYEHNMVLDLLERGHPAAAQKVMFWKLASELCQDACTLPRLSVCRPLFF